MFTSGDSVRNTSSRAGMRAKQESGARRDSWRRTHAARRAWRDRRSSGSDGGEVHDHDPDNPAHLRRDVCLGFPASVPWPCSPSQPTPAATTAAPTKKQQARGVGAIQSVAIAAGDESRHESNQRRGHAESKSTCKPETTRRSSTMPYRSSPSAAKVIGAITNDTAILRNESPAC